MARKEGKLEKEMKIFYARDFLLPVVGWFTYAKRSYHTDKTKERTYGIAIHITQLAWMVGLSAWAINHYSP